MGESGAPEGAGTNGPGGGPGYADLAPPPAGPAAPQDHQAAHWSPPYEASQAHEQPPGQPHQQLAPPAERTPPDHGGPVESTNADGGDLRNHYGPPVPPSPPGTQFLDPAEHQEGGAREATPQPGAGGPGTRVMSETMIGGFDFLEEAPQPGRPVHEIAPPPDQSSRQIVQRFGISFVPGDQELAPFLDELRRQVGGGSAGGATRVDSGPAATGIPSVLLVGGPHTGQRRMSRIIAMSLANAGIGDGVLRTADADDVRPPGAGADSAAVAARLAELLASPGPPLLFERLDVAITEALDPAAVVEAVRRVRRDPTNLTPLIATCEPRAYKRLAEDHPRLAEVFQVFRMPDLSDLAKRMTLLHVLAEERRVTLAGSALEVAEDDLNRLRGPGDLVNARLVEAYLDHACQRHVARAGASRDRLVLVSEDFTGVAESLEPALRPPGDVDGYLSRLDALLGLDEVKQTVESLVAEAREAADRARFGVQSGGTDRNLLFLGPPGTGKTTVAGLIGGAYAALGLLDSGHVVACRPVHLVGRDQLDTENRVAGMIDQASGGLLLIQESHLLDRSPHVVRELLRQLAERRTRFMIVCTGPAAEMEGFLAGNPDFREQFGSTVEFEGLTDRQLVQLYQSYAERDLYLLEEELRVELLARFGRLRAHEDFAYARTARMLFEETVARQAARLSGADVNAATVARLAVQDLPETALGQMFGGFRQDRAY